MNKNSKQNRAIARKLGSATFEIPVVVFNYRGVYTFRKQNITIGHAHRKSQYAKVARK